MTETVRVTGSPGISMRDDDHRYEDTRFVVNGPSGATATTRSGITTRDHAALFDCRCSAGVAGAGELSQADL